MIATSAIAAAVRNGVIEASANLREDVRAAIALALETESNERGRFVLRQILDNAEIARIDGVPVCQDTGTVWVRIEVGEHGTVCTDVYEAVDAAVREASREGGLRMSVARDALLDRDNTGDNTPAFVEIASRPGPGATVHVMLKGGGSDNASRVAMLPPTAGWDGVRDVVMAAVLEKAASACPPLVIGVGVGTTFDKVGALAKRALLVPLDSPTADSRVAAFESELLSAVNATGIGPGGLGGDTTALSVRILTAPCHIAAMPVAVNLGCCAMRSVSVEVTSG